ncbi:MULTISPECIES: DUF6414 family protein [Citromicrobium]|uniref:DUF6414 family protein n=2 Tax=Sphingomonadaceae TaxID=41297 RepID=UPI0002F96586|nr:MULTISPECIES: hypothetical protein [Citromicrobium]
MIIFKRQFPWVGRRNAKPEPLPIGQTEPLREFVYLDEVSLASLLASQKGEATENVTSQSGDESTAEVGGKVSSNTPMTPSAEVSSRFQTTNSNSLQTVSKATAQSRFRELHKFDYLRKIKPVEVLKSATSLEDLKDGSYENTCYRASDLKRGDLVEFKVQLSASWIFQISTMVAEFSEMFDQSPTMFMESVNFLDLYQAKNANKIISKLLAGLIPVDGVVSDYVVIADGEQNLIVHRNAISGFPIECSELRIVGVTEHLAYWKDIRRVLFADNEFTMLCRLSKSGIQNDWNPIKVADIFRDFAPDLARQIETSSRAAMTQSASSKRADMVEPIAAQLALALARYKDRLLSEIAHDVSEEELVALDRSIAALLLENTSAEGQRAAFAKVKALIEVSTRQEIDPSVDFDAREAVRKSLDLPLFPRSQNFANEPKINESSAFDEEPKNLLDVEVIAIYW